LFFGNRASAQAVTAYLGLVWILSRLIGRYQSLAQCPVVRGELQALIMVRFPSALQGSCGRNTGRGCIRAAAAGNRRVPAAAKAAAAPFCPSGQEPGVDFSLSRMLGVKHDGKATRPVPETPARQARRADPGGGSKTSSLRQEGIRHADFLDQSGMPLKKPFRHASADRQPVIEAVDAALFRIEREPLECVRFCTQPIPSARLNAVPWARLCRDCKEQQDTGAPGQPAFRTNPSSGPG